jgi:hypothetical protein
VKFMCEVHVWSLWAPTGIGAHGRSTASLYLSELLIEVKLVLMVPPSVLTMAIIASEMPAAIRPYSIAVAPDSSDQNLSKRRFNLTSRYLHDLVILPGQLDT